jgi:hypothetical protein
LSRSVCFGFQSLQKVLLWYSNGHTEMQCAKRTTSPFDKFRPPLRTLRSADWPTNSDQSAINIEALQNYRGSELTSFHLAYNTLYFTVHLYITADRDNTPTNLQIRTTTPSCPLANGPNPINFYVYLVIALCTIVCIWYALQ